MKKLILCLLALCPLLGWGQKVLELQSPDKTTKAQVTVGDELTISLEKNGTIVLEPSAIGMNIRTLGILGDRPTLKNVSRRSVVGQTVSTPIYKKSVINEDYNELTANFKGGYSVCVRCYNQGVAYRFITDQKAKEIYVDGEKANFRFPEGTKGYAAYSRTNGTLDEQYFNSFENPYDYKLLTELDSQRLIYFPFLAELPSNVKVCITESDLQDYPGMFLLSNPKGFDMRAMFAAVPKATAQGYWNKQHQEVKERYDYIARTSGKRSFPWRIFSIASKDQELLNNDLVYLLASPSRVADTSWIKPGKVAWDWWNDWNLTNVDFHAGVNNETYKYYIDFASKNGIEYVILDDGWALNGDMMKVVPAINLPELIAYGKSKNVGLILWGGFWSFHANPEQLMKHYSELGIKGFKIDFMDRDDQTMIDFMWNAAQMAAQYKLLIDYHGTCKPFGLQRTFPNIINYEGVNGLEQMKWMDEKYDQVMYDLQFPFIRMLAGPVDYTQGAMRNAVKNNYRPIYTQPMSQGTRCRQLAEYVIFESPLNMLCDSPTNYAENMECTDFIAAIPTVWDETQSLDSKISNYIHMARRKGDIWYLGGINNWEMREATIDLSFLPEGSYNVEIFIDGMNADRNASDYKKVVKPLSADKQLKVKMYPGGGYAARIQKR